jgi:hypothetical protein
MHWKTKRTSFTLIAAGILFNPWLVAWLAASRNYLSYRQFATVLIIDLLLIGTGFLLFKSPGLLGEFVSKVGKYRVVRGLAYIVYCVVACTLLVELGLRGFAAYELGAHQWFYGTRFHHSGRTTSDMRGRKTGYLKYQPYQHVQDRDRVNGEYFSARINNAGFRGRDFALDKPAGTLRVVTLGASSTFGFGNRDNETYPVFLEQILNAGAQGFEFEVLNMAIAHNKSWQILALLKEEVLPLKPDIVTFYEGINNTPVTKALWWARVKARIMLAVKLESIFDLNVEAFGSEDVDIAIRDKSFRFFQDLTEMATVCQTAGIRFIVVSQQAKSHIVPKEEIRGVSYEEEYHRIMEKLRTSRISQNELSLVIHQAFMAQLPSWAEQHGVEYVNGIRALDSHRDQLTSWVHLTPTANRILAGAIAETVLRVAGITHGSSEH